MRTNIDSMTKHLGQPSDLSHESITVDEAMTRLLDIQQRAVALFIERRSERPPDAPTRMQTHALRIVRDQDHLSVTELAQILNVSTPTASQLVNTLVSRGWLLLDVSTHDRRRHEVSVTESGRALLHEHQEKRLTAVKAVMEQLSPHERAQLVSLLDRAMHLWQHNEGSTTNGN